MAGWELLPKLVLLLACAAAAGLLMRALRQSVIVGYLLAGLLLGPSGFSVLASPQEIEVLSELGVALLLFTIGLEFSFDRLWKLGRIAGGGGASQMALTAAALGAIGLGFGRPFPETALLAMACAMSSTAVVMRGLMDRAELDSNHGRSMVAILLFQDLAVIPVMLATGALAGGAGAGQLLQQLAVRVSLVALFAGGAWAIARFALPRVLSAAALSGSRDIPVVVAVCTSIAASGAAHGMGFSPSLGAFLAGIVLAGSPFATQIRADVTPLSAVFVTLFFSAVGTAVRIPPDARHIALLIAAAAAVMLVKAATTAASVWLVQRSLRTAIPAGAGLSQLGEFTFIIAAAGQRSGVVSDEAYQFVAGTALLTLIATPWAMAAAPGLTACLLRNLPASARRAVNAAHAPAGWRRVLIIGFGPAGRQVASGLAERGIPFLVLEMNPVTVAEHRAHANIELGDATQREVLQHAGAGQSIAIVVTIPDPATARLVCLTAQALAPSVPIIVRSRYHQYSSELVRAGADRLVDEEISTGVLLAREALACVGTADEAAGGARRT